MTVSYKRLWHLLIDKEIKKTELCRLSEISAATLHKLNHGENVNIETLTRICGVLKCNVEDIVEFIPNEEG